ncbi:MAG: polysaccharide deacetylase family protein [Bacteroidota bacterium]
MKYFENYKEIKKLKPEGMRGVLRSYALDCLSVWDKLSGLQYQLNKPRVQFIYIHHVFKDEEIKLEKLLKKLSLNHTFISYSDAVRKILEGKIDKPYICISSDDGFKNNVKAAEILNRYGAKACFFINPFVVDQKSYTEIKKHCRDRLSFPPVEFMDWKDIETIQKMGHEIGSHTMEHINVAETEIDIFRDDCKKTYELIKMRCGEAKHFAFPYGRFFHFNETARQIVFNSGFVSCATAERGCHINHGRLLLNEELFIRRDHVVLDWNIDHIFHFLAANSKKANTLNNLSPYTN